MITLVIELLLPAMASVRREAPHPWIVTPRWVGERPADPGEDPARNSPAAPAPPAPVLAPPHRRPAVAAAGCHPRHPAARLRRGRRLPGRAPIALGARGTGPPPHLAPSGL